jgi:chaperonin GroEL
MKILYGEYARNGIKKGIDKCVESVKVSLGHNGKNVLIYNGNLSEIINDGVTIAKFVESKDETEMAGIRLAQQCAAITDRDAGDGTTTTLVLLQSFLNEILDAQLKKPRELRKEILESVERVMEKLEKSAKKVENIQDIENVATTSSLNPKIGKMIAEIFDKLGKDASITIDATRRNVLESEIIEGYQFDSEQKHLYAEDKEEFLDVPFIVFDKKVEAQDILEKVNVISNEKGNSLVVIGREFSNEAIGMVVKLAAKGFKTALIRNMEINEDDLKALGNKAEKIIITPEKTTIIKANGEYKVYADKLKTKLEKEESEFEREKLVDRIAKLTNGIAVVTVGGSTDLEREEIKLKVEDAINAAKTAYKYGTVQGAGLALKNASEGEIIADIAGSVYKQICENAEEEVEVGENVRDSLLVVKTALRSASSVATSILTAEAALIYERETESDN